MALRNKYTRNLLFLRMTFLGACYKVNEWTGSPLIYTQWGLLCMNENVRCSPKIPGCCTTVHVFPGCLQIRHLPLNIFRYNEYDLSHSSVWEIIVLKRHRVHQLWYCKEYWPCVQHALEPLGSALHFLLLNYWSINICSQLFFLCPLIRLLLLLVYFIFLFLVDLN